jgi:hypothetical protein
MLSRREPVLRLCLSGIAPANIPAYLVTVGWQRPPEGLAAVIAEVAPLVDKMHLDLDVDDAVRGKIGLECYVDDGPELAPRLTALLGYLRTAGLCTDTKAGGLAAWYGLTHERWCRDAWPADLRTHADRPSGGHSGGFLRRLHHVKLVFDPPQPLQAKAYLASHFTWIDDAALKRLVVAEAG